MAVTRGQDAFLEGGADVDLVSHTPNLGGPWAEVEDTATQTIVAESARDTARSNPGTASARVIYSFTPSAALGSADYSQSVLLSAINGVSADDPFFFIFRWIDASNYYSIGVYPSGAAADCQIFKKVAGVVTNLASGDFTPANGQTLKASVIGTSLKLFINGVERLSATDSALSATGVPGFGWGNAWVGTDDASGSLEVDDYLLEDETAAAKAMPVFRRSTRFFTRRF